MSPKSHFVGCQPTSPRYPAAKNGHHCAPRKGGAFQWVQIPPGNRSSRKQPEQLWSALRSRSLEQPRASSVDTCGPKQVKGGPVKKPRLDHLAVVQEEASSASVGSRAAPSGGRRAKRRQLSKGYDCSSHRPSGRAPSCLCVATGCIVHTRRCAWCSLSTSCCVDFGSCFGAVGILG